MQYDFNSLSPIDFEHLSRDLLQKELEITFESFGIGRDNGIDFRFLQSNEESIVVQCKHYTSAYSNLRGQLKREELAKITSLTPNRYILVTSMSLTPRQKNELFDILSPFCIAVSDIYCREDLNNLLAKYPEIERQHIKLWLNSVTVLQELLNAKTTNISTLKRTELLRKSQLYVTNKSFERAKQILESHNFCIITGEPGIGKSTLAQMLLMDLLKDGYEPFWIRGDISEAITLYAPNQSRAFYYDDFLGETSLNIRKNEAQDILDFIVAAGQSTGLKLIFTTREYILEEAKLFSEKLSNSAFDSNRCLLQLNDYSLIDRAEILYNHLYFSDLPPDYRNELLKNENYMRIVHHSRFNPRIIEQMTNFAYHLSRQVLVSEYVDKFLEVLNTPKILWHHAFESLTETAKSLIIVLSSFSFPAPLKAVKQSYEQLASIRGREYHFARGSSDFERAVQHLQGSFVITESVRAFDRYSFGQDVQKMVTISYASPAIRDYIEGHVSEYRNEMLSLLESFIYFEQCENLWIKGRSLWGDDLVARLDFIKENSALYAAKLLETSNSESCSYTQNLFGFEYSERSLLQRLLFTIYMFNMTREVDFFYTANNMLEELCTSVEPNRSMKESIIELFRYYYKEADISADDEVSEFYNRLVVGLATYSLNIFLYRRAEDLSDYMHFVDYIEYSPIIGEEIDLIDFYDIQQQFIEEVNEILSQDDELQFVSIDDIEEIAYRLDVDLDQEIPELKERLHSDKRTPSINISNDIVVAKERPNQIRLMFNTLESD